MTDFYIGKTAWLDKYRLTSKRRIFVLSYLETLSATEAARKAAYKFPNRQGPRLLTNVGIKAAVKEGRAQIEETIQVRAQDVAHRWWLIATTPASDLFQVRIGACRYCHGKGFKFQWRTKREYEEASASADEVKSRGKQLAATHPSNHRATPQISDAGGYGYSSITTPHLNCPECDGSGIPYLWFADTRDLSPETAVLFDGAKQTSHGIEISTLDRLKALNNLARHLGMFD